MAIITGKCPGCGIEITGSRDVDTFIVATLRDNHVYAVVCKACSVIIGTVPQTR